ncbi:uncharacterized protein DC041_0002256 [Schistosoma bovis]|uniref:Uncharacterized protein n=1 Tax=Schistosoma bovis TaxID=6184 RepID=A0A430Q5W2_SCHBO|nr:uncharacterized protein DC041_0002256 [Schistosoma bovis]
MIDLLLKELKYLNHVDIVNKCLQEALFILYRYLTIFCVLFKLNILNKKYSFKFQSKKPSTLTILKIYYLFYLGFII